MKVGSWYPFVDGIYTVYICTRDIRKFSILLERQSALGSLEALRARSARFAKWLCSPIDLFH